ARHGGGRVQRGVGVAGGRDRQCRRVRGAPLPCRHRFCARGRADRRWPLPRTGCGGRPDRRRVVGRARHLSCRGDLAGAGEPARSAGARHFRRTRRRDGCDRLACGAGRGSRTGGRPARPARHRPPGRRYSRRTTAGGTMALEKGWLTVALALMVAGIAWAADKRPLPALRMLAAAVAVLVMARITWEPRIVGPDVGTTPIFNWLLYGYGIPAAAFAV